MLWTPDDTRTSSADLDLLTYIFDFCLLLFQPFIYCLERGFQFLHLSLFFEERLMFFDELVKQHRVHRFIADGVDFPVLVVHYQVRIHLGNFLGDQTKLRCASLVALIVKGHWFERQIASLALSIDLISFLNRIGELIVPS